MTARLWGHEPGSRGTATVGSRHQAGQWRPWLITLVVVWFVKCSHQLFKSSINLITNRNPVYSRSITWQYQYRLVVTAKAVCGGWCFCRRRRAVWKEPQSCVGQPTATIARHSHPSATAYRSNLSARIRLSPSFLVLIFFLETGGTQDMFSGSLNLVMD
jgi:hypothetical protein